MYLNLLAADGGGSGGSIASLGLLLLIPVAMYFLMIRPQRRRMREQQSLQSQLEVGDEVITSAGLYGFITEVNDDFVWLEIDDDVQVRMSRAAIQGKVDTSGHGTDAKPAPSSPPAAIPPADAEPSTPNSDSTDTPARDAAE